MKTNGWLRLASLLLLVALGSLAVPAAAQVTVSSANPSNAPQGSTNLIVKIGGSGFKNKGNSAAFYVTGSTTDTGGITVNSTAFVNSSEVDANVTISSTATISSFDIYVTSGGRTGKGNDLFAVTSNTNSSSGCVTQGPAAGWTLVGVLNPATNGTPQYTSGALGTAVRVALVSAPDSNGNVVPQFYAGLAGSGSGAQTIAFVLNLDGTVRHSRSVLTNFGTRDIEVGDVNGDGVPDFVSGTGNSGVGHLFIGHLTGSAATGWDYNIAPSPSSDVISFSAPPGGPGLGYSVALGDLNGDGIDEIAAASPGGGTGKKAQPGALYIFSYANSTLSLLKTITDPGNSAKDAFGTGLAIGDLTTLDGSSGGTRLPDVAVVASNAGLLYVFQDPLGSVPGSSSLSTLIYSPPAGQSYAGKAGIADVDGDGFPDLVAIAGGNLTVVLSGPLYPSESPSYTLAPDPSLATGWGTGFGLGDIDGDGKDDVLVGAPNAIYNTSCNSGGSPGAAYVFRTGSGSFPSYSDLFEVPVVESTYMGFGWSMAAAPFNSVVGQPIVLIGENGALVGTQDGAGQIYIYRKTQ